MKKLLTFIIAFISALQASGQIEWVYEPPFYSDYAHTLIYTKAGNYVLLHGFDDTCCPSRLTNLDSNGSIIYDLDNEDIPMVPVGNIISNVQTFKDVFEMPDSSIALSAVIRSLDTSSGEGHEYDAVLKLNQAGELTQIIKVFSQNIDIGLSLSDGSYIILDLSSSRISRIAGDGINLWQKNLVGYDCLSMLVTNTDSIIIATAQGLIVLDGNGNITSELGVFVFEKIKTYGQGGIVGVKEDSIYLLSPEHALLAKTGFSGDNIKDFAAKDSAIVVLTNANFVYLSNASLSFVDNFQLMDDMQFKFIAIGGENLILSGNETYGDTAAGLITVSSFIKEYSSEGSDYDLSNDVGVVEIEQGTAADVAQNSSSSYTVFFKNVKVVVHNFGNKPVNTLYLRAKNFRSKKINNLSLLPGEDIELTWESLESYFSFDPAGQLFNLCIWTSHPDFRLDFDSSNDTYCMDFLVNSGEVLTQNNIIIYPNPASDIINIQLEVQQPVGNFALRILDVNGKVVKESLAAQMKPSYSIPVSDWATGIYFLQVLGNGAVVDAKKFVILK